MGEVQLPDIPSQTLLGVNTCGSTHAQLTHNVCVHLSKASLPLLTGAHQMHLPTPHADRWLFVSLFASCSFGTGWFKLCVLLATDSTTPGLGCQCAFTFFPLEWLVLPQGEMCRACLIMLCHHRDWKWLFSSSEEKTEGESSSEGT